MFPWVGRCVCIVKPRATDVPPPTPPWQTWIYHQYTQIIKLPPCPSYCFSTQNNCLVESKMFRKYELSKLGLVQEDFTELHQDGQGEQDDIIFCSLRALSATGSTWTLVKWFNFIFFDLWEHQPTGPSPFTSIKCFVWSLFLPRNIHFHNTFYPNPILQIELISFNPWSVKDPPDGF